MARAAASAVTGTARVDRRTKNLIPRLAPGEVAVIDHEDLDRIAAEGLLQAGVGAVVNAARSISGRYPNTGPLLLAAAGVPLVDGVGAGVLDGVQEGTVVTVDGEQVMVDGVVVASGTRHDIASLEALMAEARQRIGIELSRFAENTLEYVRRERHLVVDGVDVPDVPVELAGRHALIVVRGVDYREDLLALRRGGYLSEVRPVLIGVDGGADALLEIGCRPDLIVGDFDSVSEEALRSGAHLVVHAFDDGTAPGAARLDAMGLPYTVFRAPGTSEDIAMLLADEHGADLIVAVGTHSSMVEFLDKGRAGMASTFLVRLLVGPKLVDAKGVNRLYRPRLARRDVGLLVGSAFFCFLAVTLVSQPFRDVLVSVWILLRQLWFSVVG